MLLVIPDPLLVDCDEVSSRFILVKFKELFIDRLSGCP